MSPFPHTRRRPIARFRRGVFLIPSLLTTANILCGFTSIVRTFERDFHTAGLLIIAAAILDGLDGRIARMTGGTSDFGGEYDSLADVVSFGLAPAFLILVWGLGPMHRYGWMVAFLFLACGAVRLARFNIQHGASDRRFFVGLPIPMAASAVAGTVLYTRNPLLDPVRASIFAAGSLVISFLMVSRIRYRSFKDVDLRSRRSFRTIVPIAVALGLIAVNPPLAVLIIASVYLVFGPVSYVVALVRDRRSAVRGAARAAGGPTPAPAPERGAASGHGPEGIEEAPSRAR